MFVAANKGSYVANAGKSRHLTDAFKYTNAFSYNPIDTVKSGMKAKAAKDIAKTKYDAQKDYYAQTGEAKLDGLSEYNKAAEVAKGKQRMAGGLALLGGLAYTGAKWKYNKDNPLPEPEKRKSADNSGYIQALESQIEGLKTGMEALNKFTNQDIPSAEELYKKPDSTKSDTSSTPASKPGGATATATIPFKFSTFDDLDNKAFGIIHKYEAGSFGFDAVNQGGIKGGTEIAPGAFSGKFSDMSQHGGRKLTDLSISEIMELQSDPGRKVMSDAEFQKQGKLHAAGGYQFIGSTLKDEVTKMGIDLSTKFTPEVQSQIAKSHALRLGGISPSTWVGLKNMTPAEKAIIDQWNARLK